MFRDIIPVDLKIAILNNFVKAGLADKVKLETEAQYIKQFEVFKPIFPIISALVDKIKNSTQEPLRIVEFGCGDAPSVCLIGNAVAEYYHKKIDYVGIDVNPRVLDQGKEFVKKALSSNPDQSEEKSTLSSPYCQATLIACDASQLEQWFTGKPFDVGVFLNPIVENPQEAAKRIVIADDTKIDALTLSPQEREKMLMRIHIQVEEELSATHQASFFNAMSPKQIELWNLNRDEFRKINGDNATFAASGYADALIELKELNKKTSLDNLQDQYEQFQVLFHDTLPRCLSPDADLLIETFYDSEYIALNKVLGLSIDKVSDAEELTDDDDENLTLVVKFNQTALYQESLSSTKETEEKTRPTVTVDRTLSEQSVFQPATEEKSTVEKTSAPSHIVKRPIP